VGEYDVVMSYGSMTLGYVISSSPAPATGPVPKVRKS
jgi:hypothetical protein